MINILKKRKIPLTIKISAAYAVCNILQRCISFITLPLFTRILTTEQYGQCTIYSSWNAILSIFLTLNLAYGSFSTAMVKYEKDRDGYIASIEGICLMLTFIFLILYFPFKNYWNQLFELPTAIVILSVAEILSVTAIILWSGKKRFEFKYKSVIAVSLINSIMMPLAGYFCVIHSAEKGYARIAGQASINIIIGGSFFLYNIVKGKKIFNKKYWKYALGFNIPLITYYLSQTIFNASDRIMISHYLGKGKAALYGVAYSLATVLLFIISAINNSYVPWFYEKLKNGKEKDNQIISCIIAIFMAVMLLGVIWFAPEIIIIMAGKQYEKAIWAVAPVAMSSFLLVYTQFFINIEFFYEEKGELVLASVGAAIINVLLNMLLIPRLGFIAAAYTTMISYMVFCFANYLAMKRVLSKNGKLNKAYNYKLLIIILIGFLLFGFIGMALYSCVIIRFLIAIIIMFLVWNRRKLILKYYEMIKREL